jgi:hypothetical protein
MDLTGNLERETGIVRRHPDWEAAVYPSAAKTRWSCEHHSVNTIPSENPCSL